MHLDGATWMKHWSAAVKAATRLGGEATGPTVSPPASSAAIASVESELGFPLPVSLREVIARFSGAVTFRWHLPPKPERPAPFSGQCEWNLDDLPHLEAIRQEWFEAVFRDPDADPHDAVWQNKLPFMHIANGDLLAIDRAAGPDGPVVYLSHDGDDLNGARLGGNFIDFLDRWTPLDAPGPSAGRWSRS
jgi:cell wall assembly regulator SMI1